MRQRIMQLMQVDLGAAFWCGTFHGLNHRWLRYHYEAAQLSPKFQVLDSDDQLALLKRTQKDLSIDPKQYPPKQSQNFINSRKDEGLRPDDLAAENPWEAVQLAIYERYEQLCP